MVCGDGVVKNTLMTNKTKNTLMKNTETQSINFMENLYENDFNLMEMWEYSFMMDDITTTDYYKTLTNLLNTTITQQMWEDYDTNPNNPICLIDDMMEDVCDNEYTIWDWDRIWMNSIGEMDWDDVCEYFNGEITIGGMISSLMSNVIDDGRDWYWEDRQPTTLTDNQILN
jgi:hypothetical protein